MPTSLIIGGIMAGVQGAMGAAASADAKRVRNVEAGRQQKLITEQEAEKRKADAQKRAADLQASMDDRIDADQAGRSTMQGGAMAGTQLGQLGGKMKSGRTILGG